MTLSPINRPSYTHSHRRRTVQSDPIENARPVPPAGGDPIAGAGAAGGKKKSALSCSNADGNADSTLELQRTIAELTARLENAQTAAAADTTAARPTDTTGAASVAPSLPAVILSRKSEPHNIAAADTVLPTPCITCANRRVELERTQQELAGMRTMHTDLEEGCSRLRTDLTRVTSEKGELEQLLTHLRTRLDKQEIQLTESALPSPVCKRCTRLTQITESLEQERKEKADAEEEVRRQRTQLCSLQTELSSARAAAAAHERALLAERQQHERCQRELDSAQDRIRLLEMQLGQARTGMREAQSTAAAARRDRTESEAENAQLRTHILELETLTSKQSVLLRAASYSGCETEDDHTHIVAAASALASASACAAGAGGGGAGSGTGMGVKTPSKQTSTGHSRPLSAGSSAGSRKSRKRSPGTEPPLPPIALAAPLASAGQSAADTPEEPAIVVELGLKAHPTTATNDSDSKVASVLTHFKDAATEMTPTKSTATRTPNRATTGTEPTECGDSVSEAQTSPPLAIPDDFLVTLALLRTGVEDEAKAWKQCHHVKELVKVASLRDVTVERDALQIRLKHAHDVQGVMQFCLNTAEAKLAQLDQTSAQKVAESRRTRLERLKRGLQDQLTQLTQRARDTSILSGERLRQMVPKAEQKQKQCAQKRQDAMQRLVAIVAEVNIGTATSTSAIATVSTSSDSTTASMTASTTEAAITTEETS